MAAGFHERKVNGDICPVMKNFELSTINHPSLRNDNMSVSSNFKNHLRNIFTNHDIQGKGKQIFHWCPFLRVASLTAAPSKFMILIIIIIVTESGL